MVKRIVKRWQMPIDNDLYDSRFYACYKFYIVSLLLSTRSYNQILLI